MKVTNRTEIKITGVLKTRKQQLKHIAKYEELTVGAFLRKKLRDIVDQYPEDVKNPVIPPAK